MEIIILSIIIIVFVTLALALILIGFGVKRWKRATLIIVMSIGLVSVYPRMVSVGLKLFPDCDEETGFTINVPKQLRRCDCFGLKADLATLTLGLFRVYDAAGNNKCLGVITKTWTEQAVKY